MKKPLILAPSLIFTLLFTACNGSPTPETPELQIATQMTEEPTLPPTETPAEETPPDERIDLNVPENMIATILTDARMVFGENSDAMADNQGGQFGGISQKRPCVAEACFEFIAHGGENAFMPLNTLLDEFEGVETAGEQAILITFQLLADQLYFTLKGKNEFGVNFNEDGQPHLFLFSEAIMIPFERPFTLENERWYTLLMAIDHEGNFRGVIWPVGAAEGAASISTALGERDNGDSYKNSSWKFFIGFNGPGSVKVSAYDIYTFSGFAE